MSNEIGINCWQLAATRQPRVRTVLKSKAKKKKKVGPCRQPEVQVRYRPMERWVVGCNRIHRLPDHTKSK